MTQILTYTSPLIKNIQSRFNYGERWNYLEIKGKELFGPTFNFHPSEEEIIIKLIIWFFKDEQASEQFNIDLRKGILLSGPVGCGKTTIMKLFKSIMKFNDKHYIYSCREIAFEYAHYGHQVFNRYTRSAFHRPEIGQSPIPICFDDLGSEPAVQFYGNSCNPMSEILFSRYDYFTSCGMITHITTNCAASLIECKYGIRVRSRIREMMNIISFKDDTKDKRV